MELRNGTVIGQVVLRPELVNAFEEGVRVLFSKWTALVLAVENEWGGRDSKDKLQLLVEDTLSYFLKNREHYVDELEEELEDALIHDFNTQAEDGSPREVANALVNLYKECLVGNFATLDRLRACASGAAASQKQVVDRDGTIVSSGDDSGDDEDGDTEMMDSEPSQANAPLPPPARPDPVVDSDGFTLVQGRRRR